MQMWQYKKSQMVEFPIEKLMPEFYARNHFGFMSRFYREGTSKVLGNNREIFILKKDGFITSALLYVKLLNSLDRGVQVVGFLFTDESSLLPGDPKEKGLIVYEHFGGQMVYCDDVARRKYGLFPNIYDYDSLEAQSLN